MTPETAGHDSARCSACCEPIQSGATICPHCGTHQHPTRWSRVSTALKWLGGILTVISLLIGVVTLSGHFQDWREERTAVTELVDAAEWLLRTGNYPQAWATYQNALELKPGNPIARRGQFNLAQRWLRDFHYYDDDIDELLDQVTAVLYQGLSGADDAGVATILAHVAWVQIIRAERDLPVPVVVDDVFEQALATDPDNTYANAMSAYWRLRPQHIDVDDVLTAEQRFAIALSNDEDRSFVRGLQISRLARQGTFGKSNDTAHAVLAAAIRASHSMMKHNEPRPARDFRIRILDSYGFMGRAKFVEGVVDVLPPEEHLAVHAWLLEGLDYDQPYKATQAHYVRARLTEAGGDHDGALAMYNELLLAEQTSDELDKLVNAAIKRLTGQLPARAFARDYFNDPVDEFDPWRFHSDTLVHFDPLWRPKNFTQARDFFREAIERDDPRLAELLETLPPQIERVRKIVKMGDERARRNAYVLSFSVGHHDQARSNLIKLFVLYADALVAEGELDRAVATLTDAERFAATLGDGWDEERAWISFRLARAHALRAGKGGDATDITAAVEKLAAVVDSNSVDGNIASWAEITGDDFASLRSDPDYQELIRGR